MVALKFWLDCDYPESIPLDGGPAWPVDLGWHHRGEVKPWLSRFTTCQFWPTGCWYDGSTLAAFQLARAWADSGYDNQLLEESLRSHL